MAPRLWLQRSSGNRERLMLVLLIWIMSVDINHNLHTPWIFLWKAQKYLYMCVNACGVRVCVCVCVGGGGGGKFSNLHNHRYYTFSKGINCHILQRLLPMFYQCLETHEPSFDIVHNFQEEKAISYDLSTFWLAIISHTCLSDHQISNVAWISGCE